MRLLILSGLAAMALGAAAQACSNSSNGGADGGGLGNGTGSGAGTSSGTGTGSGIQLGTGTGTLTGPGTGTGTGSASGAEAGVEGGAETGAGEAGAEAGVGEAGTETGPGTGSGTGTGADAGSGSGSGDAAACHKPPVPLHAETAPGVYCPFSAVDGGHNQTCTAAQHCCEPASGSSSCVATGTACAMGDTDWICEGAPDCAGSSGATVCCGVGTINMQAACGIYPAYPYVSGFKGTSCNAACPAGSFQVCSQDSECPGGAAGSCVPIEPKGNGVGYCQ